MLSTPNMISVNHYQCDLLLSEAEYVNLCKRTAYFTNAEQFEFERDLLTTQTHEGITHDNFPHRRVVEHIKFGNEEKVRLFMRYPSHIILRPQRTIQLFRLLSANSFSIQQLLRIEADLQTLVLFLDYFQIRIWNSFFQEFLNYESFRGRNKFLKILAHVFPENHPV